MANKKITDLDLRSNFDDTCNFPVDDTTQTFRSTGAQLNTYLAPNYQKAVALLKNMGLSVTAAASAMTIALKQSDGSTNPTSTAPNVTEIAFRSPTITSGARVVVSFSAALSIVIPSTATMGYANGANALVYVYAYYDGTNKGLMVSTRYLNEDALYAFTAVGASSTADGLYADAIRSGAAIRLLGKFQVDAITTAGTWTSPTSVAVVPFSLPARPTSIVTKTSADYTVTDTDGFSTILFSTGNSNRVATIPSAIINPGRKLTFKKTDTGTGKVTVTGTMDGTANFLLCDQDDWVSIESDGALWYIVGKGIGTRVQSRVRDSVGAGYGSTNTKIRRIETSVVATGNAVTVAYSATNGNSYTVNQAGFYKCGYTDRRASNTSDFGISLNSNQLTTSIVTITNTMRISSTTNPTNDYGFCGWSGYLAAGDVIRPHGEGLHDSTDVRVAFEISKIAI